MSSVTIACVQMNSGSDIQENLVSAAKLISAAAKDGAELICTPENTDFMCETAAETLQTAKDAEAHPGIPFFSVLAKELGVWILIGSMKIKVSDTKVVNRSFLFRDTGQLVASYDKIHLYDVSLQNGEDYKESETVEAGTKAVLTNTPWGKLGMSICYDVRFPHMYRKLAKEGAQMLAIPAAFTAHTGMAHWETLLRARAIETGSFIIAPAQCGTHAGGRKTHGHSMIVGPWGQVLAEKTEHTTGFISRKIDFLDVTKARAAVPSLEHDRDYDFYKAKDNLL